MVEPVQNAGGCLAPPPGYGARLREVCDRYGLLLWCDEVITGFGRLGAWFGSDRLGFDADMITFAKGVTSGQAPLGGVLFTDDVAAPLLDQKTVYAHGFTFGGHPLSCAVALANLDIMERLDVLANVRRLEDTLGRLLDDVAAASPLVVEARGHGFFRAHRAARRERPARRAGRDPPRGRDRAPGRPGEPVPGDLAAADLHRRSSSRRSRRGSPPGCGGPPREADRLSQSIANCSRSTATSGNSRPQLAQRVRSRRVTAALRTQRRSAGTTYHGAHPVDVFVIACS